MVLFCTLVAIVPSRCEFFLRVETCTNDTSRFSCFLTNDLFRPLYGSRVCFSFFYQGLLLRSHSFLSYVRLVDLPVREVYHLSVSFKKSSVNLNHAGSAK